MLSRWPFRQCLCKELRDCLDHLSVRILEGRRLVAVYIDSPQNLTLMLNWHDDFRACFQAAH